MSEPDDPIFHRPDDQTLERFTSLPDRQKALMMLLSVAAATEVIAHGETPPQHVADAMPKMIIGSLGLLGYSEEEVVLAQGQIERLTEERERAR